MKINKLTIIFLAFLVFKCDKNPEKNTAPGPSSDSGLHVEKDTKGSEQENPESNSKESESFVYVTEKSGLFLRSAPSTTSEKLDLIPYGTKLPGDDINLGYGEETIMGAWGRWEEITYKNQSGYVFTGFLSHINPMKKIKEQYTCQPIFGFNFGKEFDMSKLTLFEDQTYIEIYLTYDMRVIAEGPYEVQKDVYTFRGNEKEIKIFYKISDKLVHPEDRQKFIAEPNIIERLKRDLEKKEKAGEYSEEGESVFVCLPE